MKDFEIPFYSLGESHREINERVLRSISDVYQRNNFILGDELSRFEAEFAKLCGTNYCAGVGSGLDALFISLKMLGIGQGDEVIVPAHTYIATWMAVTRTRATIVPVDVDQETMLLNLGEIEKAISSRTKCILPVHLYGNPCDMEGLMAIAKRRNVLVVEDNAQAHGAKWNQKPTGGFGAINATSFYPTKNLGALGDGGAVTTDDENFYRQVLAFRNYGSTEKFVNNTEGINSRLDELQAAVLRVKLQYLEEWNKRRTKLATLYSQCLTDVEGVQLPTSRNAAAPVFHLYVIRTSYRTELKRFLEENGVETMIHYPIPPHLQKVYSDLGFGEGDFPMAESIARTALSLPLWPGMSDRMVYRVCDLISTYAKKF